MRDIFFITRDFMQTILLASGKRFPKDNKMVTFFLREQYMFSFHTLTICYKTLSVLFLIYYMFYIEYKV